MTSTDKWSNNANDALLNRDKHIARIGLSQLRDSEIDWSQFSAEKSETVELKSAKQPRSHQIPAIEAVVQGFETVDRGKLIMAPVQGKPIHLWLLLKRWQRRKMGRLEFYILFLVFNYFLNH